MLTINFNVVTLKYQALTALEYYRTNLPIEWKVLEVQRAECGR